MQPAHKQPYIAAAIPLVFTDYKRADVVALEAVVTR